MRPIARWFPLFLILVLALPAGAAVLGQSDQEVKAVADPVLDRVLAGLNDNNFQKYSQDFDDTLKEAVPEKKFQQVRAQIMEKLGKYQSRTFLGALRQNNMSVVLYKGRFEKTDSDILIKLVATKRQGRILVTGLWFQ